MYLIIFLFFIITSSAVELNSNKRIEKEIEYPRSFYVIGKSNGKDSLVASSKFFRPALENEHVIFTETFYSDKFLNPITQVTAMELNNPWTGSGVHWVAGGPGYNFVTLKFISQPGQSINMLITILASPGQPATNK